jgi:hypothetical protein
VTLWSTLAGGFLGTVVLTSGMQAATAVRLTRIDLPFLLGTALTQDRTRAGALGYALHFILGLVFAMAYYAVFAATGVASWWFGAAVGLIHGLFAGTALVNSLLPLVHPRMGTSFSDASTAPLLEPPGFLLLNYGSSTPVVLITVHVLYGALIGGFAAA